MTYRQLKIFCCWLLLVAGCGEEAGYSGRDHPTSSLSDQDDTILHLVRDFNEVPLEGVDEASDLGAYRRACKTAEDVAAAIWKLSGDPDRVIDFWTIQRHRFDAEAERSEELFRRAVEKERSMSHVGQDSRRFHNLRCLYLYPIEMSDEHILMEVVSNKFFSADREEFDESMAHLRKAIGRNIGYDEQLRLLHPNRK